MQTNHLHIDPATIWWHFEGDILEGKCVVCGEDAVLLSRTEHVFYCSNHATGGKKKYVDLEGVDLGVTPRQLQALLYSADRYSSREISEIMEISVSRVNELIRFGMSRFGVGSKDELRALFREMKL